MEPQVRVITNDDVLTSATEPFLYHGCDQRLFWMAGGLCFLVGVALLACFAAMAIEGRTLLWGEGGNAALFVLLRWLLRQLAEHDPLMVDVYRRHLRYRSYYAATGKLLRTRLPHQVRTTR
jgi:type IV secretory pathway TrbD component